MEPRGHLPIDYVIWILVYLFILENLQLYI